MTKRSAIVVGVAVAGVLALASTAAAATFAITNTNDSGPGSLRTAIDSADAKPDFDQIVIEATGTIQLESSLTVESAVAIRGPGAAKLAITPDTFAPLFVVSPAARVSVRGISFKGGVTCMENHGTLTVQQAGLSKCIVAIENVDEGSRLTVLDATLADRPCRATNQFPDCTGIINRSGTAVIRRSTISGFYDAIATYGGAAVFGRAHTTVSQSTLRHNRVAVLNTGRTIITRSTLGDNSAFGIYNRFDGSVAVIQSTLSGKGAAAIVNDPHGGSASTTLRSTIVADTSRGRADCRSGGVISKGYNLADDNTCHLTAHGDKQNIDPRLKPLWDRGGPTPTFGLQPTSPAVDAGVADHAPTDQRGLPRIVNYPGVPKPAGGDNSDIGAFELQAP